MMLIVYDKKLFKSSNVVTWPMPFTIAIDNRVSDLGGKRRWRVRKLVETCLVILPLIKIRFLQEISTI